MPVEYGLNPNGLLDSGMELRGVNRSVQESVAALNDNVTLFINTNHGGTSESFQRAQSLWNEGMAEMNASLDNGANAIDRIRENYQVADAKGAALFQGNV